MSRKAGKNITKSREAIEKRQYLLSDAVPLLQKVKFAKFDETVEVTLRLGVDPKHADQMVRGTVVLPHGLGKSKKVLVIASGEKVREAEAAGADIVGGEEMVEKIQKAPATINPPMVWKAWVKPRMDSRRLGLGNSSASQVMAATNSTDTPTIVEQRKSKSCVADVEKPAAQADTLYRRMLQTRMRLRPKRSVKYPPRNPKTPPKAMGM